MTQYAIFVHSHSVLGARHSGLTLVKYDDNGVVFEAQRLELVGTPNNFMGDGVFECKSFTEYNVGTPSRIFTFIKDNLTVNQPVTEISSHIVDLSDYNGDYYSLTERLLSY